MKKSEYNPKSVSRSRGSSMNEKFSSLEEVCFELRKKSDVSDKFKFYNLEKISHFQKFGWNEKLSILMLDPLFSRKTKCALTPKLLSHSPKDKWCK